MHQHMYCHDVSTPCSTDMSTAADVSRGKDAPDLVETQNSV